MTYTPSHIANFMLEKADNEGRGLSPMKLLKLVYIGYGWVLALSDRKLFDEPILAWRHGPVVRSLYDEFKHYGKNPIETMSVQLDLDKGKICVPKIRKNDDDTNFVLEIVWEIYKRFKAWDLRKKTHEPGTPWSEVFEEGKNKEIPDGLIKEHFKGKIREYLDASK